MKFALRLALAMFIILQFAPAYSQDVMKGEQKTIKTKTGEKFSGQNYGDKIHNKAVVEMGDVLTALEGEKEVKTTMKARVSEVCQVKGCWMTLDSKASAEPMVVKFQDYGFFVPKDISGKEVIIEGTAYKEVTPVEELRHYAEDAGKSKEEIAAITQPKEELKFMATGVLVLDK